MYQNIKSICNWSSFQISYQTLLSINQFHAKSDLFLYRYYNSNTYVVPVAIRIKWNYIFTRRLWCIDFMSDATPRIPSHRLGRHLFFFSSLHFMLSHYGVSIVAQRANAADTTQMQGNYLTTCRRRKMVSERFSTRLSAGYWFSLFEINDRRVFMLSLCQA